MMRPQRTQATIADVVPHVLKSGHIRYAVLAERPDGDRFQHYLRLITDCPWRASLCQRAKDLQTPVQITFRETGYFDADLLEVQLG